MINSDLLSDARGAVSASVTLAACGTSQGEAGAHGGTGCVVMVRPRRPIRIPSYSSVFTGDQTVVGVFIRHENREKHRKSVPLGQNHANPVGNPKINVKIFFDQKILLLHPISYVKGP